MHRTKCCPWVPEKGWIYLCKLLLEQHMRLLGQEFSRMSLWVSHATCFSAMPCSQWPFGHPHWSRQMPCQWKPQYVCLVEISTVLFNRSILFLGTLGHSKLRGHLQFYQSWKLKNPFNSFNSFKNSSSKLYLTIWYNLNSRPTAELLTHFRSSWYGCHWVIWAYSTITYQLT